MGVFDIVLICVLGVAFVAVVATIIYKKVTGKSTGCGCGCGCSGCNGCNKK